LLGFDFYTNFLSNARSEQSEKRVVVAKQTPKNRVTQKDALLGNLLMFTCLFLLHVTQGFSPRSPESVLEKQKKKTPPFSLECI
jgi:hypothetical protein